jgi:hypothetical protein
VQDWWDSQIEPLRKSACSGGSNPGERVGLPSLHAARWRGAARSRIAQPVPPAPPPPPPTALADIKSKGLIIFWIGFLIVWFVGLLGSIIGTLSLVGGILT